MHFIVSPLNPFLSFTMPFQIKIIKLLWIFKSFLKSLKVFFFCQEWCFEYLAFEFIANISPNWSKNVLNTYTLYIFNMAFELVDVDCRTANSSFFHCTSRIASYTLNQLCITRNISPSKPSPPSSSPSCSSSSSSSSSSSW